MTMLRPLAIVLLCAGLLACAEDTELQRPEVGATPEKLMLAALTKVEANDAQRLAVLNAYDSRNGQLVELGKRSREVVAQWHKLDRTAPEFGGQVDALAAQWGEINTAEMKARAAYEHVLATQLTPSQWSKWQDFMRSVLEAQRRAALLDETYGRGGPR